MYFDFLLGNIPEIELTMYSGVTDDDLNFMHSLFTEKYGNDLFNEIIPIEERKLTALVARKVSKKEQKQELFSVREFVKEYSYRIFKEWALLIYVAMDKRKNFGAMGEERVSISFCRSILNIPNDCDVFLLDNERFHMIIDECDKRNGYKSGDEYLAYIKNYSLKIFGQEYTILNITNINKLFELCEVDYYLYATTGNLYGVKFILGRMEKQEIGQNKVYIMKREYVHSPQFILGIVAEVFNDSTIIRKKALEVIFFNKWQKFFDQTIDEREDALYHPNSSIREGFKRRAMFFYDADNTKKVLKKKELFIAEMIDGIIMHEYGHHISFSDMEPVHYALSSNFTDSGNCAAAHVLIEVLADWAPQKGGKKGAFTRFVELAQTDVKRAARCFYVYMSDNWFVDAHEECMPLMSDILAGLAISFINPDGSVDFKRISEEKDQIYAFFLQSYKELMDKLLTVIRNSHYDLDGKKINFTDLEMELYEMYRNSRNARPLEELRVYSHFWINVFGYLRDHSKAGWELYQQTISREAVLLERNVLELVARGNGEKYKNSLREYIIKRARESRIIGGQLDIDIIAAIRKHRVIEEIGDYYVHW